VATQFEALLLRNMVAALRKGASWESEESGGQLVDHLIEDALANHLAKSGGIGLAALVAGEADKPQVIPSTEMQLRLDRWVRGEVTNDVPLAGVAAAPEGRDAIPPIAESPSDESHDVGPGSH